MKRASAAILIWKSRMRSDAPAIIVRPKTLTTDYTDDTDGIKERSSLSKIRGIREIRG
jgi:hypothetical protein